MFPELKESLRNNLLATAGSAGASVGAAASVGAVASVVAVASAVTSAVTSGSTTGSGTTTTGLGGGGRYLYGASITAQTSTLASLWKVLLSL